MKNHENAMEYHEKQWYAYGTPVVLIAFHMFP
jgi:hypothetical protein